nr:unnamed protein product [Digitaria exilis]
MAARRDSPEPLSRTTDAEQQRKTAAAAAAPGEGSNVLPAEPTTTKTQPHRPCRRQRPKPAPKDLPTVVKPKDPDTAESVATSRDKALVRGAARSVMGRSLSDALASSLVRRRPRSAQEY